jgi:hypothetical protein
MKKEIKWSLWVVLILLITSCSNEEPTPLKPINYSSSNGDWVATVNNLKVNYTEISLEECTITNVCKQEQWTTNSRIEHNGVVYNSSKNSRILKNNGYIIQVYCTEAYVTFFNCKINNTFTEITAEYAVLQINTSTSPIRLDNIIIKRSK